MVQNGLLVACLDCNLSLSLSLSLSGLSVANCLDTLCSPRRASSKDMCTCMFSISFQPYTFYHAMHLVIGKAHRSQPHTKAGLDVPHERHHSSTNARRGMLYLSRSTHYCWLIKSSQHYLRDKTCAHKDCSTLSQAHTYFLTQQLITVPALCCHCCEEQIPSTYCITL